jgi:hypothetical protein
MFDFLDSLRGPAPIGGIANYAQQQERFMTSEQAAAERLTKQVHEMQKIIDAMCKVYYAQNVKEITTRDYADKFFRTDQPIIDRAKRLELERQIKVAEMELRDLKRKVV